jgi:hypothetical protein
MSAGNLGTLFVDITARMDKLNASFNQAESRAAKTGKKIETAIGKQGFDRATRAAASMFAKLSLIEAGMRGITGVTRIFKGDLESGVALLEQLPLGIGPVIRAFRELVDEMSGINELMERWKKTNEEVDNRQAAIVRKTERIKRLNQELNAIQGRSQGFGRAVGRFEAIGLPTTKKFGEPPRTIGQVEQEIADLEDASVGRRPRNEAPVIVPTPASVGRSSPSGGFGGGLGTGIGMFMEMNQSLKSIDAKMGNQAIGD